MQKNAEIELETLEVAGMNDTAEDEVVSDVYEISYHFLPTLSDDVLAGEVKALGELLAENGATMVGEQVPSKIELAYTIAKRVAGKIERFNEGNFGWIAFEMPTANIARVKTALDENQNVLRFLIIKTTRDDVAASLSGAVAHLPTVRVTGTIDKPKREAEDGNSEVSEVALDEALETIEAEDSQNSGQ